MSKDKSPRVPSKQFRLGVLAIYESLCAEAGVEPNKITIHNNAAATLNVEAEQCHALITYPGVITLSDYTPKGNVRIVCDAAREYLTSHDPFEKSEASREAKNPMTPERVAELERRRKTVAELDALRDSYEDVDEDDFDDDSYAEETVAAESAGEEDWL